MTIARRDFLRTGAVALGIGLTGGLAACSTDDTGRSASGPTPQNNGPTPSGALDDLATRLNGQLLRPGDPGYDEASMPKNGRFASTRPEAVARCADEADVMTCVQWAVDNGVAPVGRGGGHSYAGFSTTTGLLIDLSRLNAVEVDPDSGTAVVGGSALNADLLDATADTRLFLPGGTCKQVGVGGLVLGGGIGFNCHWAGLTSDHLTATRIVTADGELRRVSATEHPDLFWALRGGAGGTYGINTSFEFEMVEVPQDPVTYFHYTFTGADAAGGLLAAFDQLCASAPDAFNADAMAQADEIGDDGPRAAISALVHGQYIGPIDELRDLLAPVLAATGEPATQDVREMGFWEAQMIFATDESPNHSFGDVSRYAAEPVPTEAIERWMDLLIDCPHRSEEANGSLWSLGWVGGDVMDSIGRTDTAYVHRGMSTLLRPTVVWPNDAPSVGDELEDWVQSCIDVIAPHTPNESYQNFPNRLIDDALEQYYAENLDRLIDVKAEWDPDDLFNNPQSIPVRR